MANQFVQVPPNSTGLKMQTFENTVGGNVVEAEAVTLVQSSDNTEVGVVGQPLRIDPTGTTTQPVSGTVAVTQATSPWVTSLTSTTLTGTSTVAGNLTNNNAAPAATNVGALTALANAANPSLTEGDQVLQSVDLSGHQRVVATGQTPTGSVAAGNPVLIAGVNGVTGNVASVQVNQAGALSIGVTKVDADGLSNSQTCWLATGDANSSWPVGTYQHLFNGSTWDRIRTPNTFKTASVAATATGNSAVWTPTTGKKFRLMRFQVTAQGLAATATGVVTVSFQDATTQINTGVYDVDVPAVAGVVSGTDNISSGWIDLGNGFLSAVANNVLNFNISAAGAGTVGTYRINVCGTEE